nr:MAG TPA: hypothetical protein [Caudoviricetes sp.]
MGQSIKREIIDNIVVTMSIYISDQDTLSSVQKAIRADERVRVPHDHKKRWSASRGEKRSISA